MKRTEKIVLGVSAIAGIAAIAAYGLSKSSGYSGEGLASYIARIVPSNESTISNGSTSSEQVNTARQGSAVYAAYGTPLGVEVIGR